MLSGARLGPGAVPELRHHPGRVRAFAGTLL